MYLPILSTALNFKPSPSPSFYRWYAARAGDQRRTTPRRCKTWHASHCHRNLQQGLFHFPNQKSQSFRKDRRIRPTKNYTTHAVDGSEIRLLMLTGFLVGSLSHCFFFGCFKETIQPVAREPQSPLQACRMRQAARFGLRFWTSFNICRTCQTYWHENVLHWKKMPRYLCYAMYIYIYIIYIHRNTSYLHHPIVKERFVKCQVESPQTDLWKSQIIEAPPNIW